MKQRKHQTGGKTQVFPYLLFLSLVYLNDISYDDLKNVIEFIYEGHANIDTSNVGAFVNVLEKLLLDDSAECFNVTAKTEVIAILENGTIVVDETFEPNTQTVTEIIKMEKNDPIDDISFEGDENNNRLWKTPKRQSKNIYAKGGKGNTLDNY